MLRHRSWWLLPVVSIALAVGCGSRSNSAARDVPDRGTAARSEATADTKPAETTGVRAPSPKQVPAIPSLAGLVDSVKAAVINVEVTSHVPPPSLSMAPRGDGFFDRFFGRRGPAPSDPREQFRRGLGSGFNIDPNGLALTNNHVVEGAVSIRVRFDDGRSFDAEVKGRDPPTDLAVIQLKGELKNLPVVKLGDSDATRVGDWVLAIGNPFGLASSVSAGILSAKERYIGAGPYDDFLQTDAAINPGNSGGPLFNMTGEVIGINTAIVGGGSGIGFAVPSNMASALLPQLQNEGKVTRGWLGVSAQDLTPEIARALGVPVSEGAVVLDIVEGGPATAAGLHPDDVIAAMDGQKVGSAAALTRNIALKKPGTAVALTVYRGGKKEDRQVKLGTRPDENQATGGSAAPSRDERHKRLGLTIQDVDPAFAQARQLPTEGALIVNVDPGSPADQAGLAPGMIIVEAGGKPVKRSADLKRIFAEARPGASILLRVQVGPGAKLLRALTIPQ